MKRLIVWIACCCSTAAFAQKPYWQQEVNYKIQVSLNDQTHTLRGQEEIEYVNNSPDPLEFIWFHIWPNAYRNDSTAYALQMAREEKTRKQLAKFRDRGLLDSLDFTVDGKKARFERHPQHIDVVKLLLPAPLAPGGRVRIATPFFVDLPEYISRSGHVKQSYMVCQWYPKPAVYDHKGWHAFPYLDQGEYYSEFGSFDVSITVPSDYIVGATGILQNADELQQYKSIGAANLKSASRKNTVRYKAPAAATKTLQYKGQQIPDFAWFADRNFVIRYDTLQLSPGRVIDVFTYHHPDGNKHWVNSTDYVKSGTRAYSSYLGAYAYPVVQAVEGPKNESSGGMEYPMITLITSPEAGVEELDAVITHEVGHNWFMSMLGSNERMHAWQDEGLNTYYQFRYEAEKYRYNSIFGKQIPGELRKMPADQFQSAIYSTLNKAIPMESPIDLPAADYPNEDEYGVASYLKASIWVYFLELNFGREKLDSALRAYFDQWKFKHPYPEDLRAVLEQQLGADMSTYFDLLKKKGTL